MLTRDVHMLIRIEPGGVTSRGYDTGHRRDGGLLPRAFLNSDFSTIASTGSISTLSQELSFIESQNGLNAAVSLWGR